MKPAILIAALTSLALGAPQIPSLPAAALEQRDDARSENVTIADLVVREHYDGTLESVHFVLSGRNATDLICSADAPDFPSKVYTCGDSKYRFALWTGTQWKYALRIYHELATAVGFWGETDVFTYCHAGGNETETCNQLENVNLTIKA